MKKAIIAVAAVMFLISCGGSNGQQVTTTNDSVTVTSNGTDSSLVLLPSPDSTKIDTVNGNAILPSVK